MADELMWVQESTGLVLRTNAGHGYVLAVIHARTRAATIYAETGPTKSPYDIHDIPWPEGMELEEVKQWAEAQHKLIKI